MSNLQQEVKFEKYRKNVQDFLAPTGELLAYGYVREVNINIPQEISYVCSQFLDLYLDHKSSLICNEQENEKSVTLKLMDWKEWHSMSQFDKRLLRDQLIFDSKKEISQIQCEIKSKQFAENGGIQWIAPILKNAQNLYYINLSNSYLNDNSVKMICDSMKENRYSAPLKWLDISDNKNITDKSMEYILSIIDRLNGFNLNCTSITDKSCVVLSDYLNGNSKIFDSLLVAKMDGNNGITESGKVALRPFTSRLTIILDS